MEERDYDFSEIQEDLKDIIKIVESVKNKGFDEWVGEYHKKDCDCSLCLAFRQGLNQVIKVLNKEIKE